MNRRVGITLATDDADATQTVGAAVAAGLLAAAAFLAVRRARRPPEAAAEDAGTVVGVAVPLTGASEVARKTAGKWG